jgi:hypothetical protein
VLLLIGLSTATTNSNKKNYKQTVAYRDLNRISECKELEDFDHVHCISVKDGTQDSDGSTQVKFGSLLTERRNRTSNNFVELYKGKKRIATICFDYIHMPGDYFMKVLSSNLSSTLHQLFDDGYLADGIQIL